MGNGAVKVIQEPGTVDGEVMMTANGKATMVRTIYFNLNEFELNSLIQVPGTADGVETMANGTVMAMTVPGKEKAVNLIKLNQNHKFFILIKFQVGGKAKAIYQNCILKL